MNWSKLYQDFLNGDSAAVIAISIVIFTIVSAIQALFIADFVRSKKKINRENQIAKKQHIERIKPIFNVSVFPSKHAVDKEAATISLQNASAFDILLIIGHPQKFYGCDKWVKSKDKFTLDNLPICSENAESIDIMIYFYDEDGRLYHQDLWICKPKSYTYKDKLYAYSPVLITSFGEGLPVPTHFIEFDKTN